MIFLRALGESDQIARLEPPIRRGEHARTRHVVAGHGDQPQIGSKSRTTVLDRIENFRMTNGMPLRRSASSICARCVCLR